ncbi:putative uncharacterized protein DDB_G0282133 [Agrilus planipennis]|uniref:Uncharacterized protein n=1 Tax=Agrilus planipennis TaxID=224129 RepID=A0A1W4WUA6_AGRPL|nr:putative uncharacterized protein DDB_G0282133 [Agrilus planipennis]
MPPFKSGFVKDVVTPGTVKQTKKRKKDSFGFEIEEHPTENIKRKLKRKIRATEELYNTPITPGEASEFEHRLTRSHKKTKWSFLPKINDITPDQKNFNKSVEQLRGKATNERKKERVNHTEKDQIPIRQTRRSTRESIKMSNQSKSTDDDKKISPKHNQKELEQELVQNELKNQRVTRTSYRKSLIKVSQNVIKNVKESAKTETEDNDNFISQESVQEILNCRSPTSLKKLHDSRLTYDLPAIIKTRRETYDVDNAASVANFAKIETELKLKKEEKTLVNDEAVLETTFKAKSTKVIKTGTQEITLKEDSNDVKDNQSLKSKDTDESREVNTDISQEIEYTSEKKIVSTETENDNLYEEPKNGTNSSFTKVKNSEVSNNDLIDENREYNEDEVPKKVEVEKKLNDTYCKNFNNSLNESSDTGNNTYTKSTDSEHNMNEGNDNVEIEIRKENNKKIENNRCEDINNSLNEFLPSGKNTIIETMDIQNNVTLKEINEKNKSLQSEMKYKETEDILTTELKELEKNTSSKDKENIAECKNNDGNFMKTANIGLSKNNNIHNDINETQNLTYEKYEETKNIEINATVIASDENKLIEIQKECNSSSIDETALNNNESNNTFATASDFDSFKNDSDDNVTLTYETKSIKIVDESIEISQENESHSIKEFLTNGQDNRDNLQSTITSTPSLLTSAEIKNNPKIPSGKITNRRSTFEIGESINHVTLLKTVCDEFGTPKETNNIKKRKYGESTPHPKKIETISMLEDETSINLIDSPEYISNHEKGDCRKISTNDSDEDVSDSVFEQKRISSINRLRKKRSKSLPIKDESLAEFLFNEKMADDNYDRNITKRKKVTFKQIINESVATSPLNNSNCHRTIKSPVKVSKIPKKLSTSLPSLVQKYSHPTTMSTPKSNAVSGLNKNKEPITKITRTKLPNFAEIHKKLFNKMEDIKEHSQRKAERTKLLLSGHKPVNNKENGYSSQKKENENSSQVKENAKSRKHLNFYQNSKPTNDNGNRKFEQIQNKSIGNRSTNSIINVKNQIKIQENKQKTKFGFKIIDGSKQPTKEEQKKAVVGKTKITKNNRDERRNHIQGVRSNRRFDLLMKMRDKKN